MGVWRKSTNAFLLLSALAGSPSARAGQTAAEHHPDPAASVDCITDTVEVLGEDLPRFSKLSKEAQGFWLRIGSAFKATMDADFRRPANQAAYETEIGRSHPHWEFMKSLGYFRDATGQIESPPFPVLLERLVDGVEALNAKLRTMGSEVQISPELYLHLIEEDSGVKQNVILSPLQDFNARGFTMDTQQSILSNFAFVRKSARGSHPLGGIENASPPNLTRRQMDYPDHDRTPVLTDFQHDLSHLDAFERHPEFAQSFARAFAHYGAKADLLPAKERADFIEKVVGVNNSKSGYALFLFSESSWITRPGYHAMLESWPKIGRLMASEKPFTDGTAAAFDSSDRAKLLEELKQLRDHWWQLFDPLGGAVNDMISTRAFPSKAQFPIHNALLELDRYLESADPFVGDQRTLAVVLNILKYSEQLSISKWETFATSDPTASSETFAILKKMFPASALSGYESWGNLYRFLYQ